MNDSIFTSRSPVVSISRHERRPSTNPSLRSSTSSLAPSAVFSSNSSSGTPRSSLGHGTSLPGLPEGIAINDEPSHPHWCTYGEHSRPITTCEGWKRHEREHEEGYRCMPNGPVERTQHGLICALCHKPAPDKTHLARHNISICVGNSREPLKKSRRSDMIRHLAQHGVNNNDSALLADRWRYSLDKKYFSCGLCIMIFSSITERSNHVDNEHWRRGHNMDAWELSNSIRGLLQGPEVNAAWYALLRQYPDLVESNLRWEIPLAEGLQLRLEKGADPGPILAKAALELSNYGQIGPNQEGLMASRGRGEMVFSPVSTAPRSPATATVVPFSTSTYRSMSNHAHPRTPLSRLLPRSPSSSHVDILSTAVRSPPRDPALDFPTLFEDSYQPGFPQNTLLRPGPLTDPNITDNPSQVSTHADPTTWSSMNISQPCTDNSRIQGHLNESGALLLAQISPPQHEQPANYPTFDGQWLDPESRNDVNISSTSRPPTSNFFHEWTAHLSTHEYDFGFRGKPLPPLPAPGPPRNASGAAEHRSNTPMDLGTG